jgi:hypothetical protein
MSQYDAAGDADVQGLSAGARSHAVFGASGADSLDERNDWSAPGALASAAMNFRDADRTPELELNEIIWQSVRGAGSVMPPPRRTGFVPPIDEDDER